MMDGGNDEGHELLVEFEQEWADIIDTDLSLIDAVAKLEHAAREDDLNSAQAAYEELVEELGTVEHALRALIKAEVARGPDFLRLANALSALYPRGSEEKRLVDAMLLAVPR